jgi:putative AlgH/UPF0301 family transcriptional regulator
LCEDEVEDQFLVMDVQMKTFFLVLIFWMLPTTNAFQPWGTRRLPAPAHGHRHKIRTRAKENDSGDWRAFRAKLVMNETASRDQSWAYDSGLLVEKGSIVVSRVEYSLGCHDLRQPYFCKCVILIVEHDEEFTQGVILNRPDDQDIVYLDDEGSPLLDEGSTFDAMDREINEKCESSWTMFYGGDLAGIYDENPLIVCLHNLTSEIAQSVSEEIMPGVYLTSQIAARALVEEQGATPDSLFTFYAFCGWDPGQLDG